ncbi:MalY/PatB family protein [Anaerotalea alkaliphila]|uniref:cysteine-S-conjugate beta-lyase n=1 Tax=Anaerotalea alkaliphila TaxID=2662126 RepID=A0A7X5KM53_9FIRM|nr:MalY/PatB family protein [Anaerotalea alkaliphila]NDL66599.1 pyridoxal phosphate-dependent aminotransferase [Anaerotalea alkaliphila]
MDYNFDEIIDRRNTNSLKYDFAAERGMPADLLPLWVADMDFQAPPEVLEALRSASRHGIFGYSESKEAYFHALAAWYERHFHWELRPEWLVKTPGVVYAIATAIRAYTSPGDSVLIQQPVYYPFSQTIRVNERKLVNNPLVYENGTYRMDLEDFEQKVVEHGVKLFLLCSPHNPVGRVWRREELLALGAVCVRHQVLVVADEIHADFTYPGFTHHVFANLHPSFRDLAITCTAPSKTFNLAGLQISNIFISNRELRTRFVREIHRSGFSQVGTMGLVACQAAYAHGGPWLEALKSYLADNLSFLREFLKERLPQIELVEPEGTYLVWLDCRKLGLSEEQLQDLIVHKAKLWLDSGAIFGPEGEGFQRINIACPRKVLEQALEQLSQALDGGVA